MSIESLLSELTAAIRENTAAVLSAGKTSAIAHALHGGEGVAGETAAPAPAAEEPAPKRTRKPKTETTVTAPATAAEEPAPAPAAEAHPRSDGPVPAAAKEGFDKVLDAEYRLQVKQKVLAYRDAVKAIQPASMDAGEATKLATNAARELLKPFGAVKFDDLKDEDLPALEKAADAAMAELDGGDDDLGLGDL